MKAILQGGIWRMICERRPRSCLTRGDVKVKSHREGGFLLYLVGRAEFEPATNWLKVDPSIANQLF